MVQGCSTVETGDPTETVVDLNQQSIALSAQQQAVGGRVEGLGEFLFGGLQLLLGFLELGDVTHYHHDGFCGVELERFGGNQAGKGLAIAAQKGHFQVADASGLHPLQQVGTDALDTPDIQLGSGFADDLFGRQANLVFERFVHLQQAAIG